MIILRRPKKLKEHNWEHIRRQIKVEQQIRIKVEQQIRILIWFDGLRW
jgi:hypothetical protein